MKSLDHPLVLQKLLFVNAGGQVLRVGNRIGVALVDGFVNALAFLIVHYAMGF